MANEGDKAKTQVQPKVEQKQEMDIVTRKPVPPAILPALNALIEKRDMLNAQVSDFVVSLGNQMGIKNITHVHYKPDLGVIDITSKAQVEVVDGGKKDAK